MDPEEVQSVWVKDGLSFQVPIFPNDDHVRVQIEDFKLINNKKKKIKIKIPYSHHRVKVEQTTVWHGHV